MAKKWNVLIIGFLALLLSGCASQQQLDQAKHSYEKKKYSDAFMKAKPAAEKGDKNAQYAIGYMYFYGRGVEKNKTLAKKWISKAADQGLPQAIKALERINAKPSVKVKPLQDEPMQPDAAN